MDQLPETLEARYELALKRVSAPQKVRLLQFIYENPDQYTHTIAAECAIGYPPCRCHDLNNETLNQLGLHLECYKPVPLLVNRFGKDSLVHKWRLVMLQGQKERQDAA